MCEDPQDVCIRLTHFGSQGGGEAEPTFSYITMYGLLEMALRVPFRALVPTTLMIRLIKTIDSFKHRKLL